MVGQHLESGAGFDAVHVVGASECGVAGARVERHRTVVLVPHQGLATVAVAEIAAVGADEVGGVGEALEELAVVDAQFVQELIDHPQDQGCIGSGADRHPLVGDGRGRRADRVDRHQLHVGAAHRQFVGGVHRVVVHDRAELGPEIQDVAAVGGVGGALESVLVHVGDAVHVVSAEDGGRPCGIARHSEAGHPRRSQRAPQMEDVEAGVEDLLGVVGDGVAQMAGDLVEGLVPADRHPSRIDAHALGRVGAPKRRGDAVTVGESLEAGVSLGAGASAVVGVVGVAEDLVDHPVVVDVGQDPAPVHADRAGAAGPSVAVGGARPGAENCLHRLPPQVPLAVSRTRTAELEAATFGLVRTR